VGAHLRSDSPLDRSIDPGDRLHVDRSSQEIGAVAHHDDRLGFGNHIDDVTQRSSARQTEAASLTDRHHLHGRHLAEVPSLGIDHRG